MYHFSITSGYSFINHFGSPSGLTGGYKIVKRIYNLKNSLVYLNQLNG